MVAVAQTTMVYESGQTYSGKIELHSLRASRAHGEIEVLISGSALDGGAKLVMLQLTESTAVALASVLGAAAADGVSEVAAAVRS